MNRASVSVCEKIIDGRCDANHIKAICACHTHNNALCACMLHAQLSPSQVEANKQVTFHFLNI